MTTKIKENKINVIYFIFNLFDDDSHQIIYIILFYSYRRRGSARAQVYGDHGTVRAQGSLGNTKMGSRPMSEMDSPPGWDSGHFYSNWIPRKIPRIRPQRSGSETGYGLLECPPNLSVGLRVCLYFITHWLFDYFLIIVESHAFHIYFTGFAH